jgi:hypothetical protein
MVRHHDALWDLGPHTESRQPSLRFLLAGLLCPVTASGKSDTHLLAVFVYGDIGDAILLGQLPDRRYDTEMRPYVPMAEGTLDISLRFWMEMIDEVQGQQTEQT